MKAIGFCIFSIFVCAVSSLDPADFKICTPNENCSQLRGLIHYNWETMTPFQRNLFRGRSWIIMPEDRRATTVTLVFKDFNIEQSIYIATSKNGEIKWKKILADSKSTTFELIETDVSSLTIYIPGNEKGRLQLYYYVGCSILSESSSEIAFPPMSQQDSAIKTCWIIKPEGLKDMGRIYLTLRDVYLVGEANIKIEELHTNTMIANDDKTTQYGIYGVDTAGQETVLVDLDCGDKMGTCEKFGNLFSMSYYTLDKSDVNCIETQKHCVLNPWVQPSDPACTRSCPSLEHIIEEEIVKEGPAFTQQRLPILKSAALAASVRYIRYKEEEKNQTSENSTEISKEEAGSGEKKEKDENEEEEEEEGVEDKRIQSSQSSKPKPVKCQLRGKYCKCLRNHTDARKYCFSKRKCKAFGFCAIGCIWSRIIICAKITSSTSIKLLSG